VFGSSQIGRAFSDAAACARAHKMLRNATLSAIATPPTSSNMTIDAHGNKHERDGKFGPKFQPDAEVSLGVQDDQMGAVDATLRAAQAQHDEAMHRMRVAAWMKAAAVIENANGPFRALVVSGRSSHPTIIHIAPDDAAHNLDPASPSWKVASEALHVGGGIRTWKSDDEWGGPGGEPTARIDMDELREEFEKIRVPAEQPGTGLRRTVIQMELLSSDADGPVPTGIDEIAYSITEGDVSGKWGVVQTQEVGRDDMARLLEAQGSDPAFILGEDDFDY
jgi:hypothetical protein